MRTDPQKYSKLIYYDGNSSARITDQRSIGSNYNPRQQLYPSFNDFFEDYKTTLLAEVEKLYNKSREWSEQILKEYSVKNSSSQFFSPDMERQQEQFCYKPELSNGLPLPIAISNNQAFHAIGVKHIFVRTEL